MLEPPNVLVSFCSLSRAEARASFLFRIDSSDRESTHLAKIERQSLLHRATSSSHVEATCLVTTSFEENTSLERGRRASALRKGFARGWCIVPANDWTQGGERELVPRVQRLEAQKEVSRMPTLHPFYRAVTGIGFGIVLSACAAPFDPEFDEEEDALALDEETSAAASELVAGKGVVVADPGVATPIPIMPIGGGLSPVVGELVPAAPEIGAFPGAGPILGTPGIGGFAPIAPFGGGFGGGFVGTAGWLPASGFIDGWGAFGGALGPSWNQGWGGGFFQFTTNAAGCANAWGCAPLVW